MADGTDFTKNPHNFKEQVDKNVNDMLDKLASDGYDDKYDILIVVNDCSIRIPMNADSYSRLNRFIEEEIEEELELNITKGVFTNE